jgi:hypothetical protein
MCDAGGKLAEGSELFGLHQTVLGCTKIIERLRQLAGACLDFRARASLNSRESLAISASAPAALAAALVAVFPFAATFFVRFGEPRRPEGFPVRRFLLGDRPMALP